VNSELEFGKIFVKHINCLSNRIPSAADKIAPNPQSFVDRVEGI
jgi:hypothetical protein